jgi:hypothetical protein
MFFLPMLSCIEMQFVDHLQCDPSHHRPAQSALSTTSSATPSNRSARLSCNSSAGGSRGSISPQSSLGESFSQSPTQGFADRAIAQTGQCFPPFPTAKPSLSPSEFTLPDTLLADSDLAVLPMQDFDPELFQLADMELDSWNANFTAFPPADNNTAWNSHEDIFASNYGSTASTLTRGVSSSEQVRSNSLPHVTTFAEQVLPCQEQDRQSRQPSQLVRDAVYTDSHGVEFDIDQWLHSTTDREDRKDLQSQLAANGPKDMFKDNPFQRGLQNPVISRDQDYILYPDSPQFDWGLEPYQISRDIGSKDRRPRKEPESGTSTKRPEDASPYEQDSQRPTSAGVRISSSNYQVPGVQSAQLLEVDQPYRYLLSPSPSDGSADVKGICVSDSNASEADDTAYDTQDALSQCSTQFNYDQSSYAHSGRARLNVVQQQCDVTLGGNDEVDGNYRYGPSSFLPLYLADLFCRVVRRTRLSPDYLHNLRPVISADVDAGSQFQSDQCDSTQFERPQGSPSGLPMPVSKKTFLTTKLKLNPL